MCHKQIISNYQYLHAGEHPAQNSKSFPIQIKKNVTSRKDFEKCCSDVSGKLEIHLSMKLKILLRTISGLICFAMMLIAFNFLIFSLNARGFIDPYHKLFYSPYFPGSYQAASWILAHITVRFPT